MPIPRVIPCLLLQDDSFVKTKQFKHPSYVGDPVNIINLFNRFEVDEIMVLDIGATRVGRSPNFMLIEALANECWVPLAYGGGLYRMEDIQRIFRIGIEKIVLNTAMLEQPQLIRSAADMFGSQAIIASMDVHKGWTGKYGVYVKGGSTKISHDIVSYAKQLEQWGAGEIFLNAIDRDGKMQGYDLALIKTVANCVNIPVIACGGAATRSDLPRPIKESYASAVAAGSLFVYQGLGKGVLVNFPERDELEALFE